MFGLSRGWLGARPARSLACAWRTGCRLWAILGLAPGLAPGLVLAAWLPLASSVYAKEPVYIAFDGAYGVKTNTAPKAIERGIRAAMEEINARGRPPSTPPGPT